MVMDEHDMMQESILWPWLDDPSCDASDEDNDDCDADPGDMDGDHESGLTSAGWGTDESYGYYGDDD
jgi:hypothetical protein